MTLLQRSSQLTYLCQHYMLSHMRTTVRLDDALFHSVKRFAAEQGLTFTEVLSQALREMLARREETAAAARPALPVFAGRGLQPGVDLDDTSALLDLMEPPPGRASGPGSVSGKEPGK